MFNSSLTDFQTFTGPVAFFQDLSVPENAKIKFQDFTGFLGTEGTLSYMYTLSPFILQKPG